MKKSLLLSLIAASSLFGAGFASDRFSVDNQFGAHEGFRNFASTEFTFAKGSSKNWDISEHFIYAFNENIDVFASANYNWHKFYGISDSEFDRVSIGASYKFQPSREWLLAGTYELHLLDQFAGYSENFKVHDFRFDARYFADEFALGGYAKYRLDARAGAKDGLAIGANASYKLNESISLDAAVNESYQKFFDTSLNRVHLSAGATFKIDENMKFAVGAGTGLSDARDEKLQLSASFWINF